MSGDASDPKPDVGTDRDFWQLVLVAVIVVALVVSASLVTALPTAQLPFQGSGTGDGGSGDLDITVSGTETPPGGGSKTSATTRTPGDENTTSVTPRASDDSTTTPATPTSDDGSTGSNLAAGGAIGSISSDPIGRDEPISELDGEVVFYVESEHAVKMRADALYIYTGTKWQRSTETTAYSGAAVTDFGTTVDGPELEQRIRLEQATNAVFAAWQPSVVSYPEQGALASTATGGLVADNPPATPVHYDVLSHRPPDDAARLRSATGELPNRLRIYNTQLPKDTPERLTRKVDDIVAGEPTTYDKAVAIEHWLETNKDYSLNTSHPASVEHLTDYFVFEMDTGYCEYFASAMATMLRTQDIPARFVRGYAPGRQVDDDLYAVHGYHAHAWVEVYFPEVGWVAFDPTPPDHQEAELEKQAEMDPDTIAFPDRYSIELNRTPVPGVPITVTVRNAFEFAEGIPVRFNGRVVGRSDAAGNVTAEVPYTRNLSITLGGEASTQAARSVPVALGDGRRHAVQPPTGEALQPVAGAQPAWNTSLPTNVTFEVAGPPDPGSSVTLTVRVAGHPLRGALIYRDGAVRGRTNTSGQYVLTLPDAPGETVRVVAERNEIRGNTTITLAEDEPPPPLNLSIRTAWPLRLPGGPIQVSVTANGTPVTDARVEMNGRAVGPATNGTVATSFPFTGSVTVRATDQGRSVGHTVRGLFRNLAIVVGGSLFVLVGLLIGLLRVRGSTSGVEQAIWARVRGVLRWVTNRIVGVAILLTRKLDQLTALVSDLLTEGRQGVRDRLNALRRVVADLSLAVLLEWLRELAERVIASLSGVRGAVRRDDIGGTGPETGPDGSTEFSIMEAWKRFLATIQPPDRRHRTPGDIARYAVQSGFDERPVMTLTEAYRDVEYGDRALPSAATTEVKDALAAILDTSDLTEPDAEVEE